MTIQTTYPFTNSPLLKGMKSSASKSSCITAYSNAVIPFGIGLAYGAEVGDENRPKVIIPSATGFTFLGVSLFVHKQSSEGTDGFGVLTTTENSEYAIGDDITVLREGRIQVYSEVAVDYSSPVYLRHTANGGLVPGNFLVTADTDKADLVVGAKWVCKTTGAGLATLELNIP